MPIRYFNEDIQFQISHKRILSRWIQYFIKNYKFNTGDINFIYTSNSNILKINVEYLDHHYYTDIITFNFNNENVVSGDIYISIDAVTENALDYSTSLTDELYRVMIHGVLHLLGFNDAKEKEKQQMRQLENAALAELYTKFLPNNQ